MNFFKRFKIGYKKLGLINKVALFISIIGILLTIFFQLFPNMINKSPLNQTNNDPIENLYNDNKKMRKSFEKKVSDLDGSLKLLYDALNNVTTGKPEYFKVMGSQLRVLLSAGNSRTFRPLLINLAEEANMTIKCYSNNLDNLNDPRFDELNKGLIFAPLLGKIISSKPFPDSRSYDLKQWMELKICKYNEYWYTPNDIIRMYSENEGGVHYDDDLPLKLKTLYGIIHTKHDGQQFNQIEEFLGQLSIYVCEIGKSQFNCLQGLPM